MQAALGYVLHLNTSDFLTDGSLRINNQGIKQENVLPASYRENPAEIDAAFFGFLVNDPFLKTNRKENILGKTLPPDTSHLNSGIKGEGGAEYCILRTSSPPERWADASAGQRDTGLMIF